MGSHNEAVDEIAKKYEAMELLSQKLTAVTRCDIITYAERLAFSTCRTPCCIIDNTAGILAARLNDGFRAGLQENKESTLRKTSVKDSIIQ